MNIFAHILIIAGQISLFFKVKVSGTTLRFTSVSQKTKPLECEQIATGVWRTKGSLCIFNLR